MANSDFLLRAKRVFVGSRLYSVLFSQVPKKCTDLDLSLLYNLIFGTHSKFARNNNILSRCARRSHRRAALLRTLQWPRSSVKRFVEGVEKSKSGSRNDDALFQFKITRCFSYKVVAIFAWRILGQHSRIRSCLFHIIHFHCSKIKQAEMYK